MQIAELGEFALIDRLTEPIALRNASTLKGVGDDCAVIDTEKLRRRTLVTTDLLM